jgi:hypothetical protein
MCQFIQLRRLSQVVLVALCAVFLSAATAQAKKPKNTQPETWNLASEFPTTMKNPATDEHGNKKVWLFATERANGAEYKRMKDFEGPAKLEAECGLKESYLFGSGSTPAILYNGGPTLEEGQNPCAPSATYRTKTVIVGPGHLGTPDYAVVGWKSPITGSVTVSGSVEPVDSNVFQPASGIEFLLDYGSTVLAGPTESHEDSEIPFGPLSVSATRGHYLYLKVGAAAWPSNGAWDSTAITLTITYP